MDQRRRTPNIRRSRPDRRYYDRRDPAERRQAPEAALVRKILVTGDRNWDDIQCVVDALKGYRPGTILVHGACRGADIICAAVAETLGFEVRAYPADWEKHKRAAGPIRNQQMIDQENKPDEHIDLCLAFHNDIENSRGTADMLKRVDKAGIPWQLHMSKKSEPEAEQAPESNAD